MQANNLFVFVYGTLRRECKTRAHKKYLQDAVFISPAKTRGVLYLIDYYPGLCLDAIRTIENDVEDQVSWVKGEVFLLKDTAQLITLDEYEGCASFSPTPHEYTRTLIKVTLAHNQKLEAWTYLYNEDTSSLKIILSGDFLNPQTKK